MGQVDEEYECVAKSRLHLKVDSGVTKKKHKKNKNKDKHRDNQGEQPQLPSSTPSGSSQTQSQSHFQAQSHSAQSHNPPKLQKTPAELAFLKMQEKMQKKRISQKASMTHKERVEKFNQHLDSLTEHFDIPKVSWTK